MALYVYRHHGSSLKQHVQSFYDKYGEFVSHNSYYFMEDNSAHDYEPNMLQGGTYKINVSSQYKIEYIQDLGKPRYELTKPDNNKPNLLPTSNLKWLCCVLLNFQQNGKEPEFDYYIDMKGQPGVAPDVGAKELETMAAFILEKVLTQKRMI